MLLCWTPDDLLLQMDSIAFVILAADKSLFLSWVDELNPVMTEFTRSRLI